MKIFPAASRAALASANFFIDNLPDYVPAPNYEPYCCGGLCIAWHGFPDKTLFVSYNSDGQLSFTSLNEEGVREGLIEFYKPKPRTRTAFIQRGYFEKEWFRPHSVWPECTSLVNPDQYVRVTITEVPD